ncbi:MAG: hypothetical protein GF384_01220, partial [Elusimicrobia bacterium]|nr:hypothetical protein [Elusimicrobiota bacterium]MBD3411654.1 hypothetical protein [Elusimicrobiota bacterium]
MCCIKAKTTQLLFLLIVLGVLSSCELLNRSHTIRLSLREGLSFYTTITMNQMITETVQNKTQKSYQNYGIGCVFNVINVREGGLAEVTVTYKDISVKQTTPHSTIEYDSSNPPQEIPVNAIGFHALVGQKFSMVLMPLGGVLEVNGMDRVFDAMVKQIEDKGHYMSATDKDRIQNQFGEDAMKEMIEQMVAIYPDHPVKINDSWSKEIVLFKGFPGIFSNTWKLIDYTKDAILIEVFSQIKPNPDADPISLTNFSMRYDLSGT